MTSTRTIGDLIGRYADLDAQIDQLTAEAEPLRAEREECKAAIKAAMDEAGTDKAAAAGLSVSIVQKDRAAYDPAEWPSIVRWAIETGNDHIVQRRLTDAKVLELVRNGVALPWGLTIEPYRDLRITRAR